MKKHHSFTIPPLKLFLIQHWLALFSWVLLAVVAAGIEVILAKHIFTIQHIECQIDQTPCPDYVQAELNKELGQSIFSEKIDQRVKKITALDPSLQSSAIVIHYPNSLQVTYTPAATVYVLHQPNSAYLVIDESGAVVDQVNSTQLPSFEVPSQLYQTLQIRSRLDPTLHKNLLTCLQALQTNQVSFTSLTVVNTADAQTNPESEVIVGLNDGKVADLLLADAQLDIQKLGYVLKSVNFTSLKQPIHEIDLRFKYPVLR